MKTRRDRALSALAGVVSALTQVTTAHSLDSSNVTLEIPQLFQISKVDAIHFGAYPGAGDLTREEPVCIFNNVATHRYDIKVKGDGAGGAFTMRNGSNSIGYRVFWVDSTSEEEVVHPNDTLSARTGASASQTCSNSTNATLKVTCTSTDVLAAPHGTYTGNVFIYLLPPSS